MNHTKKLFISVALFLVASIFAVIAINVFNKNRVSEILSVSITSVQIANDGYVISGNIRNFSDTNISVPDLIFTMKTDNGTVLNQVSVLPPNGIAMPKSETEFVKKITPKTFGANKISVEFAK